MSLHEMEGDKEQATPKRRRANIHVLRSFYGASETGDDDSNADPTDIDGPSFDAEEHFAKLLETQSVKGLLKADEETLREIKKLDSDMKTLVYENYNKFISATDTIRKMKSNVENMEEEMNKLAANMDKIEECTMHINNTLAPSREKIRELSGVYRLLKKRQFLFELPSRLKRAQEMRSFNQAVFYYTKANTVLKKYSDIPSFNSILIECESIMESVRESLHDQSQCDTLPLVEIEESIALLLDLKEQSTLLRQDFISRHGTRLLKVLEGFSEQLKAYRKGVGSLGTQSLDDADQSSDESESTEQQKAMHSLLSMVNTGFLGDFIQFSSVYHRLFILRSSTDSEKIQALDDFEEFTKDAYARYLLITRAILLKCGRSTNHVISGLGAVQKALTQVHSQLHMSNHLISGMAADVINRTVHKLIDRHFKQMKANVDKHVMTVVEIVQEGSNSGGGVDKEPRGEAMPLGDACILIGNSIVAEVEQFLDSLKLLFVVTPGTRFLDDHGPIFVAKVAVKVQQLFLALAIHVSRFYEEIEDSNPHPASPLPALLLARVCHHLESWGISHVHTLLRDLAAMSPHNTTAELSISLPDIIEKLHHSAGKLQAYYVKRQGQRLSEMVHLGMVTTPWLRLPEPRDVRLASEMIVDEIVAMRKEIGRVFPPRDGERESERKDGKEQSGRGRYKESARGGGGLFEKKLVIFGGVAGDADSIHMAVIRVCLKAFVESIRLQTFCRNAYHQIQVDAYFISIILRPYVRLDEEQFDRFMEDILSSAADRCLDGAPLDTSIVASICSTKIDQKRASNSA